MPENTPRSSGLPDRWIIYQCDCKVVSATPVGFNERVGTCPHCLREERAIEVCPVSELEALKNHAARLTFERDYAYSAAYWNRKLVGDLRQELTDGERELSSRGLSGEEETG